MNGKDEAKVGLRLGQKIAYGFGDMACNLPFQLTRQRVWASLWPL